MSAEQKKRPKNLTPYENWMEAQRIPIIDGLGVTDLRKHPLRYWERLGCEATFIHLKGMEGITGIYAGEIPPGESTKPMKHLFEQIVYVTEGVGKTEILGPGEAANRINWREGSLFALPLNVQYRMVNTGKKPAFFMATTSAPLVFDLFHNEEFVFDCDFKFTDRYGGQADYFSLDRRTQSVYRSGWIWETNFIPDTKELSLPENERRGSGYQNIQFEICENSLIGHFTDFPSGRYAKAHHHGGGAILVILRSEGYSLMWPNELGIHPFSDGRGDRVERVDWKVGSVFSPPTGWFHQHFNIGPGPVRQLALRNGSAKYPFGVRKAATREGVSKSTKEGGTQIEYEDEDPEIRRMFDDAVARKQREKG